MSRELKRLKKSSSDWLNSGNALIQRLNNAMFPVVPGSAETSYFTRHNKASIDCSLYR